MTNKLEISVKELKINANYVKGKLKEMVEKEKSLNYKTHEGFKYDYIKINRAIVNDNISAMLEVVNTYLIFFTMMERYNQKGV